MNQLEPAEQQHRLIGAKRHRSSTDRINLSLASPFTRAKAAMEAGTAGGAQDGARPYVSSKSMGAMRRLPSSNGAASEAATTQQQQQVLYSGLDDISTRVEIYKGRHSIVWNAICARTKKPIILKGYVKAKMTERNFHQVRREIRLMQLINYDGAVKLLGHFEDSTTIYLVQEMCAKGDLFKRLIRSGGMLDEKFVAGEVILPMLLTLEHLHARSIYHRDIKPENIFFTREGKFKLGDFGLAIDASLERSKSRVGTLDYMSPEVVSLPTADERKRMEAAGRQVMEQSYGEKCDIWACGVLAYELLVGKPPFEVKDEMETRKRIMYETTLTLPPHVSPEAVNFIKTALAKNAGMRPAAADLVHHAWLRPYLLAMAAASGQLDAATLSAYKNPPSLAASSSVAAAAALGSNGSSNASSIASAAAQGNSGMFASTGGVGRSASFTGISRQGIKSVPGRVQINVNVGDAAAPAAAGAEGVAEKLGRHNLSHLSVALNHHAHGSASPTMPTTPGPYGPPGMSRKPVWDSEFGGAAFTAVRTAGLSGEVPNSPTSPRAKPSGLSASGSNPLLKAALNANLNRINHTTSPGQSSSNLGTAAASGAGSLAQHHQQLQQQQLSPQQQHHHSLSSNVKQRLKEYFVARNPEVVVAPAADGGSPGHTATAGQLAQHQHQQGHGAQAGDEGEQLLSQLQ